MQNLEGQYEAFVQNSAEDERVLGLEIKELVALKVNRQPILAGLSVAEGEQEAARDKLSVSLPAKLKEFNKASEDLRAKLDEPNRAYQQYLQELKDWEDKRRAIEGAPQYPNTVKGLEAQLADLDLLPEKIRELEGRREEITKEIFKVNERLLIVYQELYASVQKFIEEHPISVEHGALQFRASIAVERLADDLLAKIHKGRMGSFYGQEGGKRLQDLLQAADFATADGALQFINQVLDSLKHDRREGSDKMVKLSDQLLQSNKPKDVYNLLFGLGHLHPRFELRWHDKPLDQLSPGERGTLLLIFYLLVDKRDVPLIIDQPEENLDNQTISTMLVPAIKEAKRRRQIIMVTHNPNLAVVCDADQVIHARLDKLNGNRVVYSCGSIENPRITRLIVDILEGTKPAFDLRDGKYGVLE